MHATDLRDLRLACSCADTACAAVVSCHTNISCVDPTATQLGGTATYEIDISTIAPGSDARTTFENSFKTAVVAAMVPTVLEASAVEINSIVAGSAVVDFTVYVPAAAAAAATTTFAAIAPAVDGAAPAMVLRDAVPGAAVNCVETAAVAADCQADCATLTATVDIAAANGGTACTGVTLACAAGDGACPAPAVVSTPAPVPAASSGRIFRRNHRNCLHGSGRDRPQLRLSLPATNFITSTAVMK